MPTLTKAQQVERDEARAALAEILTPGDTVYAVLRHVARSGMSRQIDVYVIQDNEPRRLTYTASKAIGYTYSRRWEAITVGGCGFDAGFDVVYALGRAVFADGFDCIGEDCPSNDHINGDRDHTPHRHSDPGYALNLRWLG